MEFNSWKEVTASQVIEAYSLNDDTTTTEVLLHFIDVIAGINLWDSKDFNRDSKPFMWVMEQFNNLPFNGSFETLPFSEFIYLQETMRKGNALTCDFSKVSITNTAQEQNSALWQFSNAYAFTKFCQLLPERFEFMDSNDNIPIPTFGGGGSPWFATLYSISDGDIYKSDRIAQMPCGFVFRWLQESERKKGLTPPSF